MQVSVFKSVAANAPIAQKSLLQIVEQVRSCKHTKAATDFICSKYAQELQTGFTATSPKSEYQTDKRQILQAFCASGLTVGRELHQHNGIVAFDVDDSEPSVLKAFRQRVKDVPFCVAAFNSVSGAFTGGFAMLCKVEIPSSLSKIPKELKKRLRIDAKQPLSKAIELLHSEYHKAICELLRSEAGVQAGKAGNNPSALRYISYDHNPYHNPKALAFSLQMLLRVLNNSKKHNPNQPNSPTIAPEIVAGSALDFCTQYATEKGYQLADGQKHLFISHFSIAANLLGAPQEAVEAHFEQLGVQVTSNAISYPYKAYKSSLGQWAYLLKPKADKAGKTGQWLSDLITPAEALGKLVIAPTGAGKTRFISSIEGKKILVVPTLSLLDNVATEYNATIYDYKKHSEPNYKADLLTSDFIVTTYKSFEKLNSTLWGQRRNFHIFIDEAHNLTSSASAIFQLFELTKIVENVGAYKSFTRLTATELYSHHPALRAQEILRVELPSTTKRSAKIVRAKDSITTAAEAVQASIAAGRFPIVLLNNKKGKLNKLKALLGACSGVRYLNSDTKQEEDFKAITSSGNVPQGINGLVVTTVLKEGNNIYRDGKFDVIVLGNFHSSEIIQMAGRPRKATEIAITIVKSQKAKQEQVQPLNFQGFCQRLEQQAKAAIQELAAINETFAFDAFRASQAIKSNPIKETATGYTVDYLQLSNKAFEVEKSWENKDTRYLLAALEQAGITTSTEQLTSETAPTAEQAKAIATTQAEAKELANKEYSDALQELSEQIQPLQYAKRTTAMASRAKAFERFVSLVESEQQEAAEAIQQLQQIGRSEAKYSLHKKRLKVAKLRYNKDYLAENDQLAITLKAIDANLKLGYRYTSKELEYRLLKCLELSKYLAPNLENKTAKSRKDHIFKVLAIFFEVTRHNKKQKGKVIKVYELAELAEYNPKPNKQAKQLQESRKLVSV